jgi:hypothetical protein
VEDEPRPLPKLQENVGKKDFARWDGKRLSDLFLMVGWLIVNGRWIGS